jgi:hypothetical protein
MLRVDCFRDVASHRKRRVVRDVGSKKPIGSRHMTRREVVTAADPCLTITPLLSAAYPM